MFKRKARLWAASVLCVLGLSTLQTAAAKPIQYQVTWTVEYVSNPNYGIDYAGARPLIGDVYFGTLGVDDSILSTDGLHHSPLLNFDFHIFNETFRTGIRSYFDAPPNSLGFVVEDGALIDIENSGVYNGSDMTYVDFTYVGFTNTPVIAEFYARTWLDRNAGTIDIAGSLDFVQVPEPNSVALFLLGAAGLYGLRRRNSAQASQSTRLPMAFP